MVGLEGKKHNDWDVFLELKKVKDLFIYLSNKFVLKLELRRCNCGGI